MVELIIDNRERDLINILNKFNAEFKIEMLEIGDIVFRENNNISLKGPNFNLNIKDEIMIGLILSRKFKVDKINVAIDKYYTDTSSNFLLRFDNCSS